MSKSTIVRGRRQTVRRRVSNKLWTTATPKRVQRAARNAGTSRETFTDGLVQAATPKRVCDAAREGTGRYSAVPRSHKDEVREVLAEERNKTEPHGDARRDQGDDAGDDTGKRPSSVKATWARLRLQAVPHIAVLATGGAGLAAWAARAAVGDPRVVLGWTAVAVIPTATGFAWILTSKRRRDPDTGERGPTWLRPWRARAVTLAVVCSLWVVGAAAWGVSAPYAGLLLAAVFTVAARWWQVHRPGYNPPEPKPEPTTVEPGDPRDANQIAWAEYVGHPKGPLPGSRLVEPTPVPNGTDYTLLLARGGQAGSQQSLSTALAAQERIAAALDWGRQDIIIATHPTARSAARAQVVILDSNPIEGNVRWQGPDSAVDGGRLLLGPYADGQGEAAYTLYTDGQWVGGDDGDTADGEAPPPDLDDDDDDEPEWSPGSMWSGFMLGSTGSGKSRVSESIAMLAMSRGDTVVWYLDPGDGSSSPALKHHAARYAGRDDAADMLAAIEAVVAHRRAENAERDLTGFTPTPERPGLLVIIDECHAVFTDSKTGKRWAGIAREARKVGVALLCMSQYNDLDVFGNSEALRSSLIAGNAIVLRTDSAQAGTLLAGVNVDPLSLPKIPGYGYIHSGGRVAPFRNRLCTRVKRWMRSMPAVALDAGSAAAAGEARAGDHPMGDPDTSDTADGGSAVFDVPNLADYLHTPNPEADDDQDGDAARPDGSKGAVLTAVAAGASTRADVARVVGLGNVRVSALLRQLVDDGELYQPKHGQYAVAEKTPA